MLALLKNFYHRYLDNPEAGALVITLSLTVVAIKLMGVILIPITISILLAYLLGSAINLLTKIGISPKIARTVVFSLFLGLFLFIVLYLIPLIWDELVNFTIEFPSMLQHAKALIFKLHDIFPELIPAESLEQLIVKLGAYLLNLSKEIVAFSLSSLVNIVAIVVYLILVPLLVFFFLKDGNRILTSITQLLPMERPHINAFWNEAQLKVRYYLWGKGLELLIVGGVTTLTFVIIGLRYAILLGTLAGISVLLPYIGFIAITIPIIIIGAVQWGMTNPFFIMLIAHLTISLLDSNLLVPLLFSESMDLHPLAIILAVLIFGNLFGCWGVFFAIPLITALHLIVKHWPKT